MSGKLIKISQWIEHWFVEGSRPTVRTVKRWIDNGLIEGEIIADKYYVYEEQGTPLGQRPKPEANALVAQFKQRRTVA